MIATCPADESLRLYALGDLDEAAAEEIESHLAACAACGETIARFDSADDTLVRHLPLAAGEGEDASDVAGWLESLRSGPPVGEAWAGPFDDGFIGADGAEAAAENFSNYELLGVLGRGGMGVVYRARHRQLNRIVAVKVLSPRLTAAPEARRRFEREIQVLGGLHHPGIVMATDAGRVGGAAYLVMELVDGVDLSRLVREGGPLTVGETCEAGRQIAEALSAAHEAGAVHRDVKPSNVMVDWRGRVKLLDFGLAHFNAVSAESLETSVGRLLGTLDYMAPEQAGSGDATDAKTQASDAPGTTADLYGLGATLFYLLTGQPPHGSHTGRTLVQQLRAVVDGDVPRVITLRADVPAELDDFIARLLSREPSGRPASAEAVAEELTNWAGGDLAARVVEISPLPSGGAGGATHTPDEDAFDQSEQALRSLSELVGPDTSPTLWVGK